MKRRTCNGRNPRDTGPCQSTAGEGFDTCARCGGRRKRRAAKVASLDATVGERFDDGLRFADCPADHAQPQGDREICRSSGHPLPRSPEVQVAARVHGAHDHEADSRVSEVPASLAYEGRGVALHHASWRQLAEIARAAGGVDALIVDAPYSERTHAGHDDGVDASGQDTYRGRASKRTAACDRKPLSYSSWGVEEVRAFVAEWAPLTRGWFCSLTDHVLAPAWEAALQDAGRYVFAPMAVVDSGSRVRLAGDGPPNWNVWLIVARPMTREFQRWATIEARDARGAGPMPGAYVVPDGGHMIRTTTHTGRRESVVGGKPIWLMRALVRDYTRPGDLVCDPCGGAFTTAVACIAEGRRFLGGDIDAAHVGIGVKRVASCPGEQRRLVLDVNATPMTQASLLETGT